MATASRIWPMAAGEPGGPPQKLLQGKGQGRLDAIIAQLFSISNNSVILRDWTSFPPSAYELAEVEVLAFVPLGGSYNVPSHFKGPLDYPPPAVVMKTRSSGTTTFQKSDNELKSSVSWIRLSLNQFILGILLGNWAKFHTFFFNYWKITSANSPIIDDIFHHCSILNQKEKKKLMVSCRS